MKTKLTAIILILITLFSNCKNKYPIYYLSDEIKEFAFYKEGSWWVYLNENTGERDCMYVDYIDEGYYPEMSDKEIIWKSEEIKIYVRQSFDDFDLYTLYLHKKHHRERPGNDLISYGGPDLFLFENSQLVYEFGSTNITFLEDTVINNKKYSNVYHVTYSDPGIIKNYYITKENWILWYKIYWIDNDSTVIKSLINSKIIK